jgi:anhydro-N-acetylmuramic acid kinase
MSKMKTSASKSRKQMIVAGVMSGTSADGIDVALVEISGNSLVRASQSIQLLGHAAFPYPSQVRHAILSAMNAQSASVADLARLNSLLGELYADAVFATQKRFRVNANLVGCHGQTLYHQGEAQPFLGRKLTTTWQTGEGAIIAARVGVPVISDFRPADMAAGGKGAPLVPYLDYLWFRDNKLGRIVQNIGGIANLTAIPAGASPNELLAFDTGPGNMVIDALTQELFKEPFDRDGKIAASGEVLEQVLAHFLRLPFFNSQPPKTAGREEFGREFVDDFLRLCQRGRNQDVIATATALTARSIADAIRRFVLGRKSKLPKSSSNRSTNSTKAPHYHEIILSGGGARNSTLVAMLAEQLSPLGIVTRFADEFGLPSDAKEAVAFAVLAYETWHRRPSNLTSATGAKRPALLGKISYA